MTYIRPPYNAANVFFGEAFGILSGLLCGLLWAF